MKIVSQSHVTDAEIEQAIRGDLEVAEVRRLIGHLAHCPACRRLKRPRLTSLGAILQGAEAAPEALDPLAEAAYDQTLDRAIAKAVEQIPWWRAHQEKAAQLFAVQRELPPFHLDGNHLLWPGDEDAEAPGGAVLDALLALSHDARYRDPVAMKDLAEAAVRVAMRLGQRETDQGRYTQAQIVDMHVRSLGELANACRRNYEFEQADELISDALWYLDDAGSGDPMIRTRLYDLLASLRIDQRRLSEALDLLAEVCERYEELGEAHLAGRALIKKGIAVAYAEDPREAARHLRRGLGMIDAYRDPMLATHGQYELLHSLIDCGNFQEASHFLLQSGLAQAFAADPLNLLKLRWLEGKILAGVKKHRRAEEILSEVKQGFLQRGRHYEAAIVGLELAAVSLRQRKTDEAEELAVEALEIFRDLKVAYEARKAVLYLREAFRQKAASAGMVQAVIQFLQKLERDPTLSFVPV
ncbi:MAG TPA: hypothetical protein VH988_32630 [Thermoanaerobaculia bacterium]|nr:hypothetical protein [Thermoanaerobaculia bacterium]